MSVEVIATSAATQDVVDTTTETSIFAPTVAANTIGSSDFLVCEMLGDCLSNNGFSLIVRIKFGGTIWYEDSIGFASVSSRMPVYFFVVLAGNNATNAQTLGGVLAFGIQGGATTGIGDFNVDEIEAMTPILNDAVAIDQTANRTFDLTVDWSGAGSASSFRRHFASLTSFKV